MNLLSSRFLIVIVFVVTGIAAVIYFNRPAPVPVSIYSVEKGTVVKTVANTRVGTVKACRRSYLAPTIPGNVAVLNVKEPSRQTRCCWRSGTRI